MSTLTITAPNGQTVELTRTSHAGTETYSTPEGVVILDLDMFVTVDLIREVNGDLNDYTQEQPYREGYRF